MSKYAIEIKDLVKTFDSFKLGTGKSYYSERNNSWIYRTEWSW